MGKTNPSIDAKSGFNSLTKTFHSLRAPIPLPPADIPTSAAAFALSFPASKPQPDLLCLIDSATSRSLSFSDFAKRVYSLANYLRSVTKLSQNDTAFVLSPNSINVPILYFALLSLGVVISPANPVSTESEISRLVQLSNPVIAFATSSTAHKLPKLKFSMILLDSPEFDSMMSFTTTAPPNQALDRVEIRQSDVAAILYSSGTTGNVKGVTLTHRNLMAAPATGYVHSCRQSPTVMLSTVPFFHAYGFLYCLKSVLMKETVVVMERFDLKKMLRAVEEFRVTDIAAAPPVVIAMAKSRLTDEYDLSSLEAVGCGGAPLGRDVMMAFGAKFPSVALWQGYGLTESAGTAFRSMGMEERRRWGSVGRLSGSSEAKIVDPDTGDALPPGKHGELWIRGPCIMKGYVGDPGATSATLEPDGWLRTGDICYIDDEGFLFVVDRLKELIKYKGYQVPPAQLENLLQSHPGIADAAVIPYPDEEAGQVPVAYVVRQPHSNINKREIMEFVAKQVAPYKKIRHVVFVGSVPRSPAGKILRKDLMKLVPLRHSSRM